MKSVSLPKLHSAVKKNNLDLVAKLVSQGQPVDAQTKVLEVVGLVDGWMLGEGAGEWWDG